jgi:uncharacterized membrane protein
MFDVVAADYPSIDTAQQDFDALVRCIEDGTLRCEGVVLVQHDEEGHVRIVETADFLGRRDAGWGGGVGVVIGLLSPPMLASVAEDATTGGVVGRFAQHKAETGIEQGLAGRLQPGTAAVLALVDDEDRAVAQQALAHCPAELVLPLDRSGVEDLKNALAEATGVQAVGPGAAG